MQQSQSVDAARDTRIFEKLFKLFDLARLRGVEPENGGASEASGERNRSTVCVPSRFMTALF